MFNYAIASVMAIYATIKLSKIIKFLLDFIFACLKDNNLYKPEFDN